MRHGVFDRVAGLLNILISRAHAAAALADGVRKRLAPRILLEGFINIDDTADVAAAFDERVHAAVAVETAWLSEDRGEMVEGLDRLLFLFFRQCADGLIRLRLLERRDNIAAGIHRWCLGLRWRG